MASPLGFAQERNRGVLTRPPRGVSHHVLLNFDEAYNEPRCVLADLSEEELRSASFPISA